MTGAKRTVALLAVLQALMMTCGILAMTLGAIVGHTLAADKSLATLPMAVTVFGTALATIPASFVIRALGWRRAFWLGTGVGLGCGLLTAYAVHAHDFALFAAGYFLMGVYMAFGNYYRFAAAEVAGAEFKSKAVSLVLAGGVFAALAGPEIVKRTADWLPADRFLGAYLALAVLALAAAVLLSFLRLPPAAAERGSGSGRPLTVIVRQPVFIIAAGGSAIGYGVMILAMTAAPLAMVAHHHALGDAAFAIQAHVLGMFAPSFFTGALIHRFGVFKIMTAGVLLLAGHVLIAIAGITVPHFVSALTLLGIGWNFLYIGGTTLLTEAHTHGERAKTQALNDFLVFGVVAVASLSSGWLLHHLGWLAVNYVALPFLALMGCLIAWLGLKRRAVLATDHA